MFNRAHRNVIWCNVKLPGDFTLPWALAIPAAFNQMGGSGGREQFEWMCHLSRWTRRARGQEVGTDRAARARSQRRPSVRPTDRARLLRKLVRREPAPLNGLYRTREPAAWTDAFYSECSNVNENPRACISLCHRMRISAPRSYSWTSKLPNSWRMEDGKQGQSLRTKRKVLILVRADPAGKEEKISSRRKLFNIWICGWCKQKTWGDVF